MGGSLGGKICKADTMRASKLAGKGETISINITSKKQKHVTSTAIKEQRHDKQNADIY